MFVITYAITRISLVNAFVAFVRLALLLSRIWFAIPKGCILVLYWNTQCQWYFKFEFRMPMLNNETFCLDISKLHLVKFRNLLKA